MTVTLNFSFLDGGQQPVNVVSEPTICDDPATNADCAMVKGICHYAFKDVEQGG